MDMCLCAHMQYSTHKWQRPHVSMWCTSHCRNSHTSQTHLFWAFPQPQHSSGCISPKDPTAFNQLGHEVLQMGLSVGWDYCGRVGEREVGGDLVIVNIFVPPSSLYSTSPPTLHCVTLLRDPCWTAWATLALPYSAHTHFQSFTS